MFKSTEPSSAPTFQKSSVTEPHYANCRPLETRNARQKLILRNTHAQRKPAEIRLVPNFSPILENQQRIPAFSLKEG